MTPSQCLRDFLAQDYQFVQAATTIQLAKCFSGNHFKDDFRQNCPDTSLILTERPNGTLSLQVESEVSSEDEVIFKRTLIYDKHIEFGNLFSHKFINVGKQLKINLNDYNNYKIAPWHRIILQVLVNDLHVMEYGFLFFVQENTKVRPKLTTLFGFAVVPYKAFERSMVLNETFYKRYAAKNFTYDRESISRLLNCDLVKLWKKTCPGLEMENEMVHDTESWNIFKYKWTILCSLIGLLLICWCAWIVIQLNRFKFSVEN